MRVVVTGGAGFIGANLLRELTQRPEVTSVLAVDDLSTGRLENLDGVEGVALLQASILDRDALDAACHKADAIVHLAARPSVPRSLKDPVTSHAVNATGTVMVLEAARRHGNLHTVVASSSSVYGATPTLPKHEDLATAPLSPYAASKLATESYARAYAACFDLPVLAFRFFNVFGPLQAADHAYAAVIPRFIDAALANRPLFVHGDGKQTRDFTYVGSVARVLAEATVGKVTGTGPVNLAFGSRRTLLEMIACLERIVGGDLHVEHVEARPGDVRDSQADSTRLHELFPEAEPADFEQGLRETVRWFRTKAAEPARVAAVR